MYDRWLGPDPDEFLPPERDSQVFLLRNPAQLTSFLIREVPCLGQELRLRWLSASIVFAREILSEKLGRVCRLVIGYGVVGAGQTDNDLVIPHLKLNIRHGLILGFGGRANR